MADHVVVMREGYVAQAAAPIDLYTEPADTDVASFIGSPPMNLLPAQARHGSLIVSGSTPWRLQQQIPEELIVGVRPESLAVNGSGPLVMRGQVTASEMLGAETLLTLRSPSGDSFVARLPGVVRISAGDDVTLTTTPEDLRFFDAQSGHALIESALA